jgi:hypothetical protein
MGNSDIETRHLEEIFTHLDTKNPLTAFNYEDLVKMGARYKREIIEQIS